MTTDQFAAIGICVVWTAIVGGAATMLIWGFEAIRKRVAR